MKRAGAQASAFLRSLARLQSTWPSNGHVVEVLETIPRIGGYSKPIATNRAAVENQVSLFSRGPVPQA